MGDDPGKKGRRAGDASGKEGFTVVGSGIMNVERCSIRRGVHSSSQKERSWGPGRGPKFQALKTQGQDRTSEGTRRSKGGGSIAGREESQ